MTRTPLWIFACLGLLGCQRACQNPLSKGPDPVAEAIRSGDLEALGDALDQAKSQDEARDATVDVQQLRKDRPLVEWVSILVKRNQLLGIRLLRSNAQMCPGSRDASVAPPPKTLQDALGQSVDATRQLWNEVGLHRIRGTPMHLAAFFCQPSMVELLASKGANPNAPDDLGLTPLHWASCAEVATALLDAGAKVNAASRDGWSPLHLAATAPLARVLVARGGDVHARDACGNQPLHTAEYFGLRGGGRVQRASDGGAPVVTAEDPQWLRLLVKLVDEVAQNIEHLGALFDVRGALLEAGADPKAVNAVGTLPESIISGGGGGFDD